MISRQSTSVPSGMRFPRGLRVSRKRNAMGLWSIGLFMRLQRWTRNATHPAPKSKHPARAGCLKWKGVFDVGALLPQFLAELTSTLNSRIWRDARSPLRPGQAIFP